MIWSTLIFSMGISSSSCSSVSLLLSVNIEFDYSRLFSLTSFSLMLFSMSPCFFSSRMSLGSKTGQPSSIFYYYYFFFFFCTLFFLFFAFFLLTTWGYAFYDRMIGGGMIGDGMADGFAVGEIADYVMKDRWSGTLICDMTTDRRFCHNCFSCAVSK